MRRRWQIALDAGTALAVVGAAALLVHDRLLPAWRQRQVVAEGERLPASLRLEPLTGAYDHGHPGASGPSVLFVFQSTCGACDRAAPEWRRIVEGLPDGVVPLAVALEEGASGVAYARRHLTGALPVRPADPAAFVVALDVRVVPTTLVVDGSRALRLRVSGVPAPATADSILRLARRLAGGVSAAADRGSP